MERRGFRNVGDLTRETTAPLRGLSLNILSLFSFFFLRFFQPAFSLIWGCQISSLSSLIIPKYEIKKIWCGNITTIQTNSSCKCFPPFGFLTMAAAYLLLDWIATPCVPLIFIKVSFCSFTTSLHFNQKLNLRICYYFNFKNIFLYCLMH